MNNLRAAQLVYDNMTDEEDNEYSLYTGEIVINFDDDDCAGVVFTYDNDEIIDVLEIDSENDVVYMGELIGWKHVQREDIIYKADTVAGII